MCYTRWQLLLYELLTTSVNGYTWNNQKWNTVQTRTVRFMDSNVSAQLHNHLLLLRASRVKQLDSFVDCEGLNRFGRFSFNNYNKEVEVHVLWLEGKEIDRTSNFLHGCYDYCSVANML